MEGSVTNNPSRARVIKALSFEKLDRIPHHDDYWRQFVDRWRMEKRLGSLADIEDYYEVDIRISTPAEEGWPSQAAVVKEEGGFVIYRNGWGMLQRQLAHSFGEIRHGFFGQELQVVCQEKTDPEKLKFESPQDDRRFEWTSRCVRRNAGRFAIIGKVGGPYMRTGQLRGTDQWLMDLAEDPGYARALASKVTDHLIQIGLEQLRRDNLYATGLWIFDDIAGNQGMVMSPRTYEKIFYPCVAKMVKAWKAAGAAKVLMHSDGNIEAVLDLFVAAGIDAVNPVEPKAGMNLERLRKKYDKRLAFVGGMCNARVLPQGSREEIQNHVQSILELGQDGGVVLAAHSIGSDISVEHYDWAMAAYRKYR